MKSPINSQINTVANRRLSSIEKHMDADVIFFYGSIGAGLSGEFKEMIEELRVDGKYHKRLCLILTTHGGSANEVERCVNVIRNYYEEIDFIVPDYAYSAGTIFCMSGDNIYMDFYSVLGPIDPQVLNKDGHWVAALGYLDKINEMIEKSKNDDLSPVEFSMLSDIDLGELREYEQAKELTIDLLKTWLVKYKFKNWIKHSSNLDKIGEPVTIEEKEERASDIAKILSDNNRWKAHGRPINMNTLQNELKLVINDITSDSILKKCISAYYDHVTDYIAKMDCAYCFHTRRRPIA